MTPRRELPWQVFQLASGLLPYIDHIFQELGFNPTGLFVLSHVKHSGVDDGKGQRVTLLIEIRRLLIAVYGYSPARATTIIQELHNHGFIDVKDLTQAERAELLGSKQGYKTAVILLKKGSTVLDQFNQRINDRFAELTADISERKFKALSVALSFFAKHAIKKLKPDSENKDSDI